MATNGDARGNWSRLSDDERKQVQELQRLDEAVRIWREASQRTMPVPEDDELTVLLSRIQAGERGIDSFPAELQQYLAWQRQSNVKVPYTEIAEAVNTRLELGKARERRLRKLVYLINVVFTIVLGLISGLFLPLYSTGPNSVNSLFTRFQTTYINPLIYHGSLLIYAEILVALGIIILLLAFLPWWISHKIRRTFVRWLPLALVRAMAQTSLTFVGLLIIGVLAYGAYWLGVLPRSVATDLFVASTGAAVLKFAGVAIVLLGKGLISGFGIGAGTYIGHKATKEAVKAEARTTQVDNN